MYMWYCTKSNSIAVIIVIMTGVDPEGSKFDNIFCFCFLILVDEGIEDPNITINWPSSARQQNAI